MAKVLDNLVTEGLSGKLGKQLVFRRGKGGQTILSKRAVFGEDRVFSSSQQAHLTDFKQASAYAKIARHQPLYIEMARGTPKNPYNIAIEDWFGQPEVLEIDITGWTGQIGQEIRVKAQDNVQVSSVRVMIRTSNGSPTALEEGEAVQSEIDGLLWTYMTKTLVPMLPGTRLDVMVKDLPGNNGGSSLELN